MRFNLIVLKSQKYEELQSQYTLLGIEFDHHQHGKGPMHYSAQLEDVVFEIYPTQTLSNFGTFRFGLVVDDLNELYQKLKDTSWGIISPPADSEWGVLMIIKDLEGRTIELTESRL